MKLATHLLMQILGVKYNRDLLTDLVELHIRVSPKLEALRMYKYAIYILLPSVQLSITNFRFTLTKNCNHVSRGIRPLGVRTNKR